MVYILGNTKEEIESAISGAYSLLFGIRTGELNLVGTGDISVLVCQTGNFDDLNSNTGTYDVLKTNELEIGSHISGDTGLQSIAIGSTAKADRYGEMTRSVGTFNDVTGSAQIGHVIYMGQTSDDVTTEIFLGGVDGEQVRLKNNSTISLRGTIVARCSDTGVTQNSNIYTVNIGIKRDHTSISMLYNDVSSSEQNTYWNASFTTDWTNKALVLNVRGSGTQNINWLGSLDTVEVIG